MFAPTTHGDAIAPVLLALAVILLVAKLGGDLASRVGQPAVLGELIGGIALGNLGHVGMAFAEPFKTEPAIDLLARLGAVILLFEVGLQSTVAEMRKVGVSSFLVACVGVLAPWLLGWLVAAWLRPNASVYSHAFVGATLTATSVGITARVLTDLGKASRIESRIVLGAAVIDDLLGLIVLTIMSGLIAATGTQRSLSPASIAITVNKGIAFLVCALVVGVRLSPHVLKAASRLKSRGVLLATGLSLCFFFAWLANALGLAPIVGAFAAGLILEKAQYHAFLERGDPTLDASVESLSHVFVPVFFVQMGMRADLGALFTPTTLLLGGVLIVVSIAGKLVSGLGAIGPGLDRLTIGVGMIPRGEVGLIFANVGLGFAIGGQP
ncbi:MAG TPA: cation:proton antiporter, partial [Polyangiaceae bacterium]|nr:cation:proton antiporter [Polyangiaceae bacterium]